ncbi:MAG: preprotein translocase subunit SecA [Firmicutes bacterium]|nr:preprotein translocase subunit SecA [Bacillota bacterium]
MGIFDALFKREKEKQVKKIELIADKIESLEPVYSAMSDSELQGQTPLLKAQLKAGRTLDDILPEAFATVREASKRVLGMRHFKVQLIGGIVLHQGRIAEMQTGEGKTLVATLPSYLNALEEKGVHIVTVNDYLAKRDSEWMGKIHTFLGLKVGVVLPNMKHEEKKEAYNADITYATNNEIGFDYLRDNMATNLEGLMQRGHNFAVVDEVDSILIDEARTPLIISAPAGESGEMYVRADRFVHNLKGVDHADIQEIRDPQKKEDKLSSADFVIDEKDKHIYLTETGIEKAEKYFKIENLGDTANADLSVKINSALRANFLMHLNKDYIVEENEIIIVDEYTGRKMIGRRYSEGLHQAIEAKEKVSVKNEDKTIATITFQNYFRLYSKLSGMTGTAMTEEGEFKGIYSLDVVPIPTNRANIRVDEPDKVYITKQAKYKHVVEDIIESFKRGQPVLVGTTSVEISEYISGLLNGKGIRHNVLNAKKHLEEATIVAQAGKSGMVTIATNMAGRGTDILLGGNPQDEADREKVISLGGLRVIGTERHEARRIDNQLRGRSGRQGDPGSSCFYLSFEDELLRLFGGDKMKAIMTALSKDEDAVIQMPILSRQIETAQKRCEEGNYIRRRYVLNYDDVMNHQRGQIYSERHEVLNGKDVHEQIVKYIDGLCEELVRSHVTIDNGDAVIDYKNLNPQLELKLLSKGTSPVTADIAKKYDVSKVVSLVYDIAVKQYQDKIKRAEENGIDFKITERNVLLNQVDKHWMNHIAQMDQLKKGIGLRGLGQRDPVMEYRREGSAMFDSMVESIRETTAITLAKLDIDAVIERINLYTRMQQRKVTYVNKTENKNVGRNDACPCGSGKKYKNCCIK